MPTTIRETRLPRRWLSGALVATLCVILWGGPAGAHGVLESAAPEPDSRVKRIPRRVSVTLTQRPLPGGKLVVRDGCGRPASRAVEIQGNTITARIARAEPGEWQVRFDFVSATDGHAYGESFSFSVAGRKQCRREAKAPAAKSSKPPGKMEDTRGMDEGLSSPHQRTGEPRIPLTLFATASAAALLVSLLARKRPRAR